VNLLFDANLSHKLVGILARDFPGCAHVRDLGLRAAEDGQIWDHVHGLVIVSKDTDFREEPGAAVRKLIADWTSRRHAERSYDFIRTATGVPTNISGPVVTSVSQMREGDIVVTRVGRHYSLGRLTADGHTQTPIESLSDRSAALSRACRLAGADHRVFILEKSGAATYSQFECP
jgi:hypothetical protein